MAGSGITLNFREFRETLAEYKRVSKKDDVTILNTQMYYVSRGAAAITHKADPNLIQIQLENLLTVQRFGNQGQMLGRSFKTVQRFDHSGRPVSVPLVALLINAQRAAKGLPGLQGKDMAYASRRFIGRAKSSAAFIAGGWVPSIKQFEKLAEKKAGVESSVGNWKGISGDTKYGRGIPANVNDSTPKSVCENYAVADHPSSNAEESLEVFATRGLQRAMDDRVKSMQEYIERKYQQTANKFNA